MFFALYQRDSKIWKFPWPFVGLPFSHCLVLDSQWCVVTTHLTASPSPLLFSHSSTVSVSTTNTKNGQLPALLINAFHPEPQLYHWNMKEAINNEKTAIRVSPYYMSEKLEGMDYPFLGPCLKDKNTKAICYTSWKFAKARNPSLSVLLHTSTDILWAPTYLGVEFMIRGVNQRATSRGVPLGQKT